MTCDKESESESEYESVSRMSIWINFYEFSYF